MSAMGVRVCCAAVRDTSGVEQQTDRLIDVCEREPGWCFPFSPRFWFVYCPLVPPCMRSMVV